MKTGVKIGILVGIAVLAVSLIYFFVLKPKKSALLHIKDDITKSPDSELVTRQTGTVPVNPNTNKPYTPAEIAVIKKKIVSGRGYDPLGKGKDISLYTPVEKAYVEEIKTRITGGRG